MSDVNAQVVRCFLQVKYVTEYYWTHTTGDDVPCVSVENLVLCAEHFTNLKIERRWVPFEGSSVRALFERYENTATIFVRADQDESWSRYAIVKELCHAINDTPGEFTTDPVKLINDLVGVRSLSSTSAWPATVSSEKLAEMCAIELLYPIEDRVRDKTGLSSGNSSIRQIAARIKVPAVMVERALFTSYLDGCLEIWKIVDDLDRILKSEVQNEKNA